MDSATSASDDSDFEGAAGAYVSVEKLAHRIQRKLAGPSTEPIPTNSHRKAVEAINKLKTIFEAGDEAASRNALIRLTCAGCSLYRRIQHGGCGIETAIPLFQNTQTLIFLLILLANGSQTTMPPPPPPDGRKSDDEMALEAVMCEPLEATLASADGAVRTDDYTEKVRTPQLQIAACLRVAAAKGEKLTMIEAEKLSIFYFRKSQEMMFAQCLGNEETDEPSNFLTLDALEFTKEAEVTEEEQLAAIAQSGESEAGMTILRDIIMSFKINADVVNIRRVCMMRKDANMIATQKFPDLLESAHDTAMLGTEHQWATNKDPTILMACLLTGIAVQMLRNSQSARLDDMWYGRLSLPFLECPPPDEPDKMRLALISSTHEWICYKIEKNKPIVKLRASGFAGLQRAILLFSKHV